MADILGRSIRSYGVGSHTMGDTLEPILRYVNLTLRAWVMRKFKRFAAKTIRAGRFLERTAREQADLFVHWRLGLTGVFA